MATGVVIREFDPYWRVVDRGAGYRHTERYVVVDVSAERPQQVHGPTTKREALAFCGVQVGIWAATKGQVPN